MKITINQAALANNILSGIDELILCGATLSINTLVGRINGLNIELKITKDKDEMMPAKYNKRIIKGSK